MALLGLANKLLHYISEHLDSERDINAFAQAIHRLYRLQNSYLYRYNGGEYGNALQVASARGHGVDTMATHSRRLELKATSRL
ncbi:hypothetical protein K458DRAFT_435297 [Lentithecium fluviatile CBS 122367]|uniref:Uncharacterized protein n=1 Tax=Lentithecium fluviatile CBS 122367 TaxID=1168545 RepID=A0A6G1IM79_9PLEO|nr:hypothetical protein K458DRAFT_435297 [Lentithecium fluviatile CBS 122367]